MNGSAAVIPPVRAVDGVADPTAPLFSVRGLCKHFHSGGSMQTVLDSLDLDLQPCSLSLICGPSGSGKSTLLSILGGMERADSGQIRYRHQALELMSQDSLAGLRNREFGFLFQTPYFVPYKNVLENILLPAHYAPVDRSAVSDSAVALAEWVGIGRLLDKSPAYLSGGELQRMAFARALLLSPKVIFADEPTASLDKENAGILMELMRERVEHGGAVIMVSHDPSLFGWCDRILKLSQGRVIE